jgi:hypothetical protein
MRCYLRQLSLKGIPGIAAAAVTPYHDGQRVRLHPAAVGRAVNRMIGECWLLFHHNLVWTSHLKIRTFRGSAGDSCGGQDGDSESHADAIELRHHLSQFFCCVVQPQFGSERQGPKGCLKK